MAIVCHYFVVIVLCFRFTVYNCKGKQMKDLFHGRLNSSISSNASCPRRNSSNIEFVLSVHRLVRCSIINKRVFLTPFRCCTFWEKPSVPQSFDPFRQKQLVAMCACLSPRKSCMLFPARDQLIGSEESLV